MRFRFSNHAIIEMSRRGISEGEVNAVVEAPDCEILEKPSMKVIYDQETDSLSVIFSEGHVAESDEGKPGIILDYADDGRLLAIEILDASSRMAIPKNVEFEVATAGIR